MKTMPAGEFKARCLRVMEEVRKYRVPVVITKKGRQVAKLVPVDAPEAEVFGCMAKTAKIVGDVEAPVLEAGVWEAVAGDSTAPGIHARKKARPLQLSGRAGARSTMTDGKRPARPRVRRRRSDRGRRRSFGEEP